MKKYRSFWRHLIISALVLAQVTYAEDVEVVKAVTAEEKQDNNGDGDPDQVALETDQDGSSSGHYQHPGPARVQNLPLALGQPFGPPPSHLHLAYHGPPPPLPNHSQLQPDLKTQPSLSNEVWVSPVQDMPKVISLDVKCEKNGMKVFLQFDRPFYGIVFSKGHYSNINCVHLPAGLGRSSATFDIGLHACGTSGNIDNNLYGHNAETGAGTYFENIIIIQYDPQVQEVWDQARKLRCTWHDQYEKSVTFRPFPVDMLDVVRADFAGDNVGCWMQIQVGKGPWASEVSGLVKIGQTMTMVLAIKDDDSKFDMLVRNCVAHDGKRAPIQLVDQRGCVIRPKLMSRFTKIKNFGASASVLSYAHFQAFKFPDSMEVHFQCTIQICRYQCPEQCSDSNSIDTHHLHNAELESAQYGPPPPPPLPHAPSIPIESYLHGIIGGGGGIGSGGNGLNKRRDERRVRRTRAVDPEKEIGLNRVIKVVSSGDLTFSIDENQSSSNLSMVVSPIRDDNLICMTRPGFIITLVVLLAILFVSSLISVFLYIKLKPFSFIQKQKTVAFTNSHLGPSQINTIQKVPKNLVLS